MEEKKLSFEDIFCYAGYSATLMEEFEENLNISKRLINWAVGKVGLKKTVREFLTKENQEKIKNFGKRIMELNLPVSLSEGYEVCYKGSEKTKNWKMAMAVLINALENEEKLGYIALTITKPETIQYFTFIMNVEKWENSFRLDKHFFTMAPMDEVKEEISKTEPKTFHERRLEYFGIKEEDLVSKETVRETILGFWKKQGNDRKIEELKKQWAEEDKQKESVNAEKGER